MLRPVEKHSAGMLRPVEKQNASIIRMPKVCDPSMVAYLMRIAFNFGEAGHFAGREYYTTQRINKSGHKFF